MRNLNGWISFLSLILLAFMVSGCSSDSDEEQNMSIVMPDSNQKNQSFNSDDVSGSFSFVATAHWTASIVEISVANRSVNTSPNWISLDKYSGEAGEYTLTITLTPNNTGKTRTATITVSSGSEEITVTVMQKSAAESEDDTDSEEYDWVKYDELYIKDDGEDHCLSTKGHYLYFKNPGFFQGGKGGEGQRMHLFDCGEVSWKDFSIMEQPEWNKETWTGELIPCVKGHGYFSAETYKGTPDNYRYVRFWVEDYIMEGGEIVGAKLRHHDVNYDNLIRMREPTTSKGKYYDIGYSTSSSLKQTSLFVYYKSGSVQSWEGGGGKNTYLFDAGNKTTYEEFRKATAPVYSADTWTNEPIPCIKGHAYYAHAFRFLNDKPSGTSLSSFYVLDYIIENGKRVGCIAQSPNVNVY
ncbi:BACON domain-containing protein [Bacteroides thetaiotaomicron]|uniref:BACON domain-containing protein n=1 Tax=Bacteroides thetaiotaomicron TaxID=818 RepID=UPI0032C100CD